jgi:hypothetical protein
LIPITKEMQEGKEPLRTFSDLMQFYKTQEEPGDGAMADKEAGGRKSEVGGQESGVGGQASASGGQEAQDSGGTE